MSKQRLRGRIPLRLALIFGIVAIVGLVVGGIFIKGTFDTVDGFTRVPLSAGQQTVTLKAGKYVGYYEAPSGSGSVLVQLAIGDIATGKTIPIGLYGKNEHSTSTLTYNRSGKHGEALFKFNIDKTGAYAVKVNAQSGTAPSGSDIALGKSIAGKLVTGVVTLVGGILFLIPAIVLLIVGLVKRSRHKKELASAGAYGYPPPPGYGAPPGYAPPAPDYGPPLGQAPPPPPPPPPPPSPQGWQPPPDQQG